MAFSFPFKKLKILNQIFPRNFTNPDNQFRYTMRQEEKEGDMLLYVYNTHKIKQFPYGHK